MRELRIVGSQQISETGDIRATKWRMCEHRKIVGHEQIGLEMRRDKSLTNGNQIIFMNTRQLFTLTYGMKKCTHIVFTCMLDARGTADSTSPS